MIKEREITAAIAAHSLWKTRLREAIDTGTIDVPVRSIEADDQCQFGQWLAGVAAEARVGSAAQFALVKRRHTEFHKLAARVARLVVEGKKAEAEAMLSADGEYSMASAMLTEAMIEWKSVLAGLPAGSPAAE